MEKQQKEAKCICGNNVFFTRLKKIESVGILTCSNCEKNYFILDSLDYWYDTIQKKYPSEMKCSTCNNDHFYVSFIYEFRENSADVRNVKIIGTCQKCNFSQELDLWEIKYGPTDSLLKNPLILCENPIIKYNLSTKNCFWTLQDLIAFLEFLYELKLFIYVRQYFENKTTIIKILKKDEIALQACNSNYYTFIISHYKLTLVVDQEINWKKEEVIIINSPHNMYYDINQKNAGLLFYIEYTLNYIEDFKLGTIKEKSEQFKKMMKQVENWLRLNYVNSRGKESFDNFKEQKRLFGDKYLKKQTISFSHIYKPVIATTG